MSKETFTSNVNVKRNGYYGIKVFKASGEEVKEKSVNKVENTITDNGAYHSLFSSYSSQIFDTLYCATGTGTTERTTDSTGLGNLIDVASNGVGASRGPDSNNTEEVDNGDGTTTISVTRVFTFDLGAINGNISEVGLYTSSSLTYYSTVFIAGQLIKNEFGEPTTITLLEDEQLQVTYVLEWTVPNVATLAASGNTTINGVDTYYEMWVQPYFVDWKGLSSNKATNWLHHYNRDSLFLLNSSYNRIFARGDLDASEFREGDQFVHRSRELSLAPSDFSSSDIKAFAFTGSRYVNFSLVDSRLTAESDSSSFGSCGAIITFDPPLVKTSDDSLKLQAEFRVSF